MYMSIPILSHVLLPSPIHCGQLCIAVFQVHIFKKNFVCSATFCKTNGELGDHFDTEVCAQYKIRKSSKLLFTCYFPQSIISALGV